MSIAMENFGMTEQPARFGESIPMPGRLFPYRLQCRACGFEPLGAIVPPPRCPKCAAGAWERFAIPRSLLMNATRQFPRGQAPFKSARNAALENRIRQATEESVLWLLLSVQLKACALSATCIRIARGRWTIRPNWKELLMLWTLVVILLILWLLGIITSYTAGGLIHILLVVALVIIVVRLLQGRRPLA
jgi:hypothetical protein